MKNLTRIMTVIGLFSISQLAYAASIPDTYTTGDTLTAEKLTTIKNAVNDNDTRVTTNASGISANTSSISAIDALPAATGLVPWIKTPSLYLCNGVPTWSTSGCKVYAVGDDGPGGGIVFYVINGGRSGLEAMRKDLDYSFLVFSDNAPGTFVWGCNDIDLTNPPAQQSGFPPYISYTNGNEFGDGQANTAAMLRCANNVGFGALLDSAAEAAVFATTDGGYADWFIPTKRTLTEMYDVIGPGAIASGLGNIGRFQTGGGQHYWSSNQSLAFPLNQANCLNFSTNQFDDHHKISDLSNSLRLVRAF